MNSLRSVARRRSDSSCSRSVPTERKAGRNGSIRSPPKRFAWCMASSASLTMSSAVFCAFVQVIRPIEAVSTISRLAKLIGARIACLIASATPAMRAGSCSDSSISANWSPAKRDSESFGLSSRCRRRAMVSRIVSPAEMPSPSLTCLKRSMSMTNTVGWILSSDLATEMIASSRFMNSSRLGRPVRLSCTASCSSRSSAFFCSVTSTMRADAADDLAVRPDDRPRAQREPVVVPVGAAQPEALGDPAAAMFEHDVERGAERVAVVRMQHRQPVAGRSAEAVRRQSELQADVGLGDHAVAQHVPVEDDVA